MSIAQRGVTILEVLISIAIISTLASLSFVVFTQFIQTQSVDKEAGAVISSIAYARSQSMSGRNDSAYGIHFASTTMTIFMGTSYNASSVNNVVRTLSSGVVVSRLALGTGVTDVVFGKLTGTPSATGTLTIASLRDTSKQRVITISGTGLVQ